MRTAAVAFATALAFPLAAQAGVKTEEKTQLQFGGFMGGLMNRFGGKAAKEGVVQTVAVAGDRKLTANEATARIVDIAEEKIYDLDMKKKTYKVTTFADLKRQIEEERAKAEQEAQKQSQREEKAQPQQPQKELQVDFDVKNTGQTKPINGFDTKQTIMTVTVHEKGRTLPQSGGVVLTTDIWLAPKIAATQEIRDFDRRYAQKMAEVMGAGGAASMQQMATLFAMYPGVQKAMEKMKAENVNLDGTPVLTTLTVSGVKSAAQMAEAERQQESGGGGLGGLLAKKMMKKGDSNDPRSMLMTSNVELLKVVPGATAADVAVPADFKLKQ